MDFTLQTMRITLTLIVWFTWLSLFAQVGTVTVSVFDKKSLEVSGAEVFINPMGLQGVTNEKGVIQFDSVLYGDLQVIVFKEDYEGLQKVVNHQESHSRIAAELKSLSINLGEFTVLDERTGGYGVSRLRAIEDVAIYAAKKNELLLLDDITANKSTNNARQVFAKVPGLNIWESDGGGLQLGIGARGLSPNRTSNFNTRQNGYDISADALGYPESYYTPPVEALERIEIVRGAASLQYGTQFGGMLNFVFKAPPTDKKVAVNSRQSIGSFGFFNSFNQIAGTVGKLSYNSFYQYKRSDGWRENSGFENHTAFGQISYRFSERLQVRAEYTFMNYIARQPGGLTDRLFEENPRQSVRDRNWFKVNWNLAALVVDYKMGKRTKLNSRTFGVFSSREALGNLDRINVSDFGENRTLISGEFNNVGNETRLIHQYQFLGNPSNVLTGVRLYKGSTVSLQGEANNGAGANFDFNQPNDLENSDYAFPNTNLAWFAENVFRLSEKWSITPGIRYEYIHTRADGWYKQRTINFAGDVIAEEKIEEDRSLERSFFLMGLGVAYRMNQNIEFYTNISENYRSVTFSDIRIANPNFRIDPNIQDESGYNADLGARGSLGKFTQFDFSLYYLAYNNKISIVNVADQPPLFLDQRLRTNVGSSRTVGLESFIETDFWRWLVNEESNFGVSAFVNFAYTDAQYTDVIIPAIEGNDVELVPTNNLKAGVAFRGSHIDFSYQYMYISEQFTDATNARFVSTAVSGVIPAYGVHDISAAYHIKRFTLEGGVNNVLNNSYFTRRAVGYPGPGIIPAEARGFYFTFGLKF